MSSEREQLLKGFLGLYERVAARVLEFRRSSNWIELAVLAMSIITAGSLWVLISDTCVVAAKWIGAVIATSLAFLTAYQKAIGPSKLLEDARTLHRDIGAKLATLRGNGSGVEFPGFGGELLASAMEGQACRLVGAMDGFAPRMNSSRRIVTGTV